jgi:hypothetical protein
VQRREGVKAGCNGKGIYGWYSGEKLRTGVKSVHAVWWEKIRNYVQYIVHLMLFSLWAFLLTLFV